MFVLFVFLFLSVASAQDNRLILSYIQSNQVRLDAGQIPRPITIKWFFDPYSLASFGESFATVERINSYQIIEEFMFEWATKTFGFSIFLQARIYTGTGVNDFVEIGGTMVEFYELFSLKGSVREYPLANGVLGLRMVNVAVTNAVPIVSPTINLALRSGIVYNPGQKYFQPLSFRCFVSQASFPNAVNLTGTTNTFTNLSNKITQFNSRQVVDLMITLWNPSVLGLNMVCGVYQDASTLTDFYRQSDKCLGAFSISAATFVAGNDQAAFPYTTNGFEVTMGTCSACPFQ